MVYFSKRVAFGLFILIFLSGCMPPRPPSDVSNICRIFKENPRWYRDAKAAERRWWVPVPVQMAIVHQESKFDAHARPPRSKLFSLIPWGRPTTAYGYSQALNGTWALYRKAEGGFFASRTNFADAVDFIGWYAQDAHRRADISRSDAYALYLAYHEGVGGYMRKTYLHKAWLPPVARKVENRARIYRAQLAYCKLR
ncbi:MAG: hypothetical protein CK424_08880 [Legionella sp.]|nr:MAG: hypothetical protein CK424_08880 [Legionella sp.]